MWSIFHTALQFDEGERVAFVESAVDDVGLRTELLELLEFHNRRRSGVLTPMTAIPRLPVPGVGDRLVGEHIGRYRVRRVIGRGGSGFVFEAEQVNPRKRVALKLLRPTVLGQRAARRLEHEARLLARLRHPNIAEVYESGTFDRGDGGQPFFAMELVEGRPLTAHADARGLDLRARVELLALIAETVHFAHQRGVVHLDLKPDNILVTDPAGPGGPVPKILDFGVARVIDPDLLGTITLSTAHEGALAGTLPYMCPEQVSGDADAVDVRADVYALGAVAYELLTGRLPLDVGSGALLEAIHVIREVPPEPMSAARRDIDPDVELIVRTALAKEPDRRYASAAGLAVDFRRFLRREPINARAPSRAYQIRRFAQRHRALVGGALATGIAITTGLTIVVLQAVRAQRAEARAVERFEQVRSLAGKVIFELAPAISKLPGSTEARRLLVEECMAYLEPIRDEGDESFQREIGAAYEQLGLVLQTLDESDRIAAHEAHRTAFEIRRRLADIRPDDVELRLDVARSLRHCGSTIPSVRAGPDLPDNPWRHEARVLLEALSETNPADARIEVELAEILVDLGMHENSRDDPAAGLPMVERGVALGESALSRRGADPSFRAAHAEHLLYLGVIRTSNRSPGEALEPYEAARRIWEVLVNEDPLDTRMVRRLAATLAEIALALALLQRWDEAIAPAERAVTLASMCVDADGADPHAFRALEVAMARQGDVHELMAADSSLPLELRLRHAQAAVRLSREVLSSVTTRRHRGWLPPNEAHYEATGRDRIERLESILLGLEGGG